MKVVGPGWRCSVAPPHRRARAPPGVLLPLAFLNNIGFGELLVILAIVLVVFGAKRLPEIARSMGQSVAEFKKGINDVKDEVRTTVETEQARINAAATTATGRTSDISRKPPPPR